MATRQNQKRNINKVYLVVGPGELLVFTKRQIAEQMKTAGEMIVPIYLTTTQERAVTTKFTQTTT